MNPLTIPAIVFLTACGQLPSYDDPSVLTRDWTEQAWPGYEVPDYMVRENIDTTRICGSPLGCSVYSEGMCVILLSPIADYNTLDHERLHCILRHNGKDTEMADQHYPVRFGGIHGF